MSIALMIYRSTDIFKWGANKLKEKILMFQKINIVSVDPFAQNKLLDSIQKFTKEKALANLKRKSSLAISTITTIAKYVMILGAVGVIGYYLGKLIKRFIDFCLNINKKYKVLDKLDDLYKSWEDSQNNIFIFLYENWNEKFNIKHKLSVIISECWDFICDTCTQVCESIYKFISQTYDDIVKWMDGDVLDDKTGFQLDLSGVDESKFKARSPYDLKKMYGINDPEVKSAKKYVENPNPVTGELDDSEVELQEEGKSTKKIDTPSNSSSSLWKAKDDIKTVCKEIGAGEIFEKTLARSSEDDVKNAEQQVKAEQQTNTNIKKTEKPIQRSNEVKFDYVQMLNDINELAKLKDIIKHSFEVDETMLQSLRFVLENRHT